MQRKTIASVLIVLALLFSAIAMFVNNPGSNPSEVMADPIVDDDTSDDVVGGLATTGPMTTNDDCGGDDVPSVPTGSDDCGDDDNECGDCDDSDCTSVPECGCEDDENECDESDDCGCEDECNDCGCDDGCTYTIGYWKNHAGLGHGNQDDMITPLLGDGIFLGCGCGGKSVEINCAAEAVNYLNRQGDSSNGINRLYAQLLAAKLNIANGASDDAVDDVIADADAFLSEHNADDWDCLSADEMQQVNEWKDILDNYNNGIIGPGHCD